ncbi:hypothetical protein C6B37_02035 [Candidatus Phytoplasma phoenicium]|uniref:Uncharacterized protein n=1 Tax=Candidatus Phytoplasma phoenicium TaxID=198422 RepID=A0A2S8NTT6_9MOLU|nr:hypothetical protein C6B37_02035 [Candidatus Phytoplasma phoenicium]
MKKSYIYDIKSILQYLSQEKTFEIICGQRETKYNISSKCLYLNYQDILNINHLLFQIPSPPFQIMHTINLTKKYLFNPLAKILFIKSKR